MVPSEVTTGDPEVYPNVPALVPALLRDGNPVPVTPYRSARRYPRLSTV